MKAFLIVLENDQIQTYRLRSHYNWKIGRGDPNNCKEMDITLSSRLVSREHGWLHNIDDQWFYVDNPRNTNGTYHNEKKLSLPRLGMKQPVLLENGDVLRIDSKERSRQGVVMLFLTSQWAWKYFALQHRDILIGSAKGCDLIIPGFGLDKKQAKLSHIDGQYYLSFCDDGTVFCNKQKVKDNVPLRYGDIIQLNGCHIVFMGNKLVYTKVPVIFCVCGQTYCGGEEWCCRDGAKLQWPEEYCFDDTTRGTTYDDLKKNQKVFFCEKCFPYFRNKSGLSNQYIKLINTR